MSPIVQFTLNLICGTFLVAVAGITIAFIVAIITLKYAAWKIQKAHDAWVPRVGDKVKFHSMAGWIDETVTQLYEDGSFRTERKSSYGNSSSPRWKHDVLFSSRPEPKCPAVKDR